MEPDRVAEYTLRRHPELVVLRTLLVEGRPLSVSNIKREYDRSGFKDPIESTKRRATREKEYREALNGTRAYKGLVERGFATRKRNSINMEDRFEITDDGIRALAISELTSALMSMPLKLFVKDSDTAKALFELTKRHRYVPTYLIESIPSLIMLQAAASSNYDFARTGAQIRNFNRFLKERYPELDRLQRQGKLTYKTAKEMGGEDFVNALRKEHPEHGIVWLSNLPESSWSKERQKVKISYQTDHDATMPRNITAFRQLLKEGADNNDKSL